MPIKPKQARQGALFAVELDDVWEQFISTTNWDKVDVAAEKAELETRAKDLTTHIDSLTSKLEQVREQLAGIDDRAKRAREHLEGAAKAMGHFATPAVLLASLREAFPPSKVKAGAPVRQAPFTPSPDIETAVMVLLDTEGIGGRQLLKAVREGGFASLDSDTLGKTLAALIKKGAVAADGSGHGKTYRRVEGDDQ